MAEDDLHDEKGIESSPLTKLAIILVGLYSLAVAFAGVYFNWQFVRREGFFAWIFLGEIVASAQALAWPYFVMHPSPASGHTFRETLLNAVDWITGVSTAVLGLLVFWFLTAALGAFLSRFRLGRVMFAFCIALCSSYSFSFALTIIALAIKGPMPPRNAVLPSFVWLLAAGMCLWESLSFGPEGSVAPAIWAYGISGTIVALTLLIGGRPFITLFTALPLFGVSIVLKLLMAYRNHGISALRSG